MSLAGLISDPFPFQGGTNQMERGEPERNVEADENAEAARNQQPPPSYEDIALEDEDELTSAASLPSGTQGEPNKVNM